MHLRTNLFEQMLQNPLPTYFENWPLTPTDLMGFIASAVIILAVDRVSYLKLRDNTLGFWKVFVCSRK